MQSKYLVLLEDFKQERSKLDQTNSQLLAEDECRQRINTLLKGQVESLDTKNQLLISQLGTMDQLITDKDTVIRSLRQENTDLFHDCHKHNQSLVDSEIQTKVLKQQVSQLTADLLRTEEMQRI